MVFPAEIFSGASRNGLLNWILEVFITITMSCPYLMFSSNKNPK